jgi:glycosyltransferase involved in cell wall biosynthesis
MVNNKKKTIKKYPLVSVCTPTFNRRPFIPFIIKCFQNQTYPKDRIEWIIIDDGTDKIGDLVSHIPQVKYFKYDEKMSLGKKRNLSNEKATGEFIVYMDDDDYYPPERISHAVETLQKSNALCAGSSIMHIYFKHINKMLQFGPYGPNHSTAATFAFKRELLKRTRFDESAAVAEERKFLQDYQIPFVQLDSLKTILVVSHNHNSFDKKELLIQQPNPYIHETTLVPPDFIKEPEILKFFIDDIDKLLNLYEPGKIDYKPDVKKQLIEIKKKRDEMIQEQMRSQMRSQTQVDPNLKVLSNPQEIQDVLNQHVTIIQQLNIENGQLKQKNQYLEDKVKQLIDERIQEKVNAKEKLKTQEYEETKLDIREIFQEKVIKLTNLTPLIS